MTDDGYKGYHLENGQVVEQYDHTKDEQFSNVPLIQQTRYNPNLITNIQNVPSNSNNGSQINMSHHMSQPVQVLPTQQMPMQMASTTQLLAPQTIHTQPTHIQNNTASHSTHNISQQPIVVLDEHKKSDTAGCCGPCTSCCKSCNRMPCCSIFSFFLILLGTAMICVCGWLVMEYSWNLWEDYGPPKGNPVFDPAPIWIKNVHSNVGFDWYKINPEYRPGNYLPWVKEGLEYFLIALAPFMFLIALLMIISSYISAKEIHERSTYTQWSSVSETNVCCTMFLLIICYILILFYLIWSCFAALAVYYYRMVDERCWNLNSQGFDAGVKKSICLDLVQLGVARFIPTTDQGYGKLCGPGNNIAGIKIYGDLERYCENYFTTYILTIVAFTGGPVVILGLLNYLMVLSTNYSIITGRYIKKFVKMDARTVDVPMSKINATPTPTVRLNNPSTVQSFVTSGNTVTRPPAYTQTNLSGSQQIQPAKHLKGRRIDHEMKNYYRD